jgi:hypothetical protein
MQSETPLTNIYGLERRFGLPASWFKAEALAGNLPCLRVGRRILFNATAIEHALSERAAKGKSKTEIHCVAN